MYMTFDLSQQPSLGGRGLGFRVPVPCSTCNGDPEPGKWAGLHLTLSEWAWLHNSPSRVGVVTGRKWAGLPGKGMGCGTPV